MEQMIQGITVEITRKSIKHMYLRVKPDGKVIVSAPYQVAADEIEWFVGSRKEWILRQREKLLSTREMQPLQYRTGDEVCLWGVPCRLEVKVGRARRMPSLKADCLELTALTNDGPLEKRELLNVWYRENLRAEIASRLPRWEETMGLYCERWQIRGMKTRWGSCNTVKKRLWFALQLAERPLPCLDYILVHELAHLQIPNHSFEFWQLVEKYIPNWRELRKILRSS